MYGMEGSPLLVKCAARQVQHVAVVGNHEAVKSRNCLLEFEPPKPTPPISKLGSDEYCPGNPALLKDRPSIVDIIAVAVIEGEDRKGPCAPI
jgi:hypothetical protein